MSAASPSAPARGPAPMVTPGAVPGNAPPGPSKVVRRMIRMPDGTLVDAPPAVKPSGPPADPKKVVPGVNRVVQQPGGPNAPAGAPGTGSKVIPVTLQAGTVPKPAAALGINAAKPVAGPTQTLRELPKGPPAMVIPPTAPANIKPPFQSIQPPRAIAAGAAKPVPTGTPKAMPVGVPKSVPGGTPQPAPQSAANNNPVMTAVGTEMAVGVGKGINLIFDGLSKKINQKTPAPKPAAKPAAAGASRGPPAPGAPLTGAIPSTGPRSLDFAQDSPQPNVPYNGAPYNQQYNQQFSQQQYNQQHAPPAMGLNRDYYQPTQPTHSHAAAAGVAGVAGGLAIGGGAVLAYDAVTDYPTGHSSTIINRDIDINTTVYNERPSYNFQASYEVPQSVYQGGEVEIIETREVDAYGNVIEYETTEAEFDAYGNLVEYTTIEETPEYTTKGVQQLYDGEVVEEVEVQQYYVEGEAGEEITEYTTEVQYDIYGNVIEASTETEIQEFNEEGELIENMEQTTIVDANGEVQYETEVQEFNDDGELIENMEQTTTVDANGEVQYETEFQSYNDDGEFVESIDQTTTVDQYGNIEVDTDVVEADGHGGYEEDYQEETYVADGDGDDNNY